MTTSGTAAAFLMLNELVRIFSAELRKRVYAPRIARRIQQVRDKHFLFFPTTPLS